MFKDKTIRKKVMEIIEEKIKEVESAYRAGRKALYEEFESEQKELERRFDEKETALLEDHVKQITGKII
jgi:translation initiation factor 2 alpha subunit (eIF-2alpha)